MSGILSTIRRFVDNHWAYDLGQFVALCLFIWGASAFLGDVSLIVMAWRLGQ